MTPTTDFDAIRNTSVARRQRQCNHHNANLKYLNQKLIIHHPAFPVATLLPLTTYKAANIATGTKLEVYITRLTKLHFELILTVECWVAMSYNLNSSTIFVDDTNVQLMIRTISVSAFAYKLLLPPVCYRNRKLITSALLSSASLHILRGHLIRKTRDLLVHLAK